MMMMMMRMSGHGRSRSRSDDHDDDSSYMWQSYYTYYLLQEEKKTSSKVERRKGKGKRKKMLKNIVHWNPQVWYGLYRMMVMVVCGAEKPFSPIPSSLHFLAAYDFLQALALPSSNQYLFGLGLRWTRAAHSGTYKV